MRGLGGQYQKTFRFMGGSLRWFLLGTGAFFLGFIVLGHIYFSQHTDQMLSMIQSFQEAVEDIAPDGEIQVGELFLNNLTACVIATCIGFIPFIFAPAFVAIINALLLGAMGAFYQMVGLSVLKMYLVGILPHGIFELPAVLLSVALGGNLCFVITRRICESRYHKGTVGPAVKGTVRTFLALVVPLLVIAALMESFVTPGLIDRFMY